MTIRFSRLTSLLLLFTQCSFAGEREIPNAQQAKERVIQKVAEALPASDTLFLSRLGLIAVCGNALEKPTVREKMKTRYYINTSEGFQSLYRFGSKVVVVGRSANDRFLREGERADAPPTVPEKTFYSLVYPKVEKNAFSVTVLNGRTRTQVMVLDFYRDKSGNWQAR